MKLSDIESKQLLPRFAKKISWVMDTLDALIRPTVERVKSIDAPLTMESIQACTDEELEALYDQYGVAQYYPDLARDTRDKMLYEMARIYRYLGTPHAIETLCEYIFDGVHLNVKVLDNLAFDEEGELVDESLLDTFDIQVEPSIPVLDEYTNTRILANIIRFSRNSQALRDILYDFPETFELPVSPLYAGIPSQNWENDIVCEPVTPPTPSYTEITLYMASGNKRAQGNITSDESHTMTTTANSNYMYALFYDPELTQYFRYDYSNDYEIGSYDSETGEWRPWGIQSIYSMPDTTSSDATLWKMGYILYDLGKLWLVSNVVGGGYMATSMESFKVRIYPKDQQYYAGYFSTSNSYGNKTMSGTTSLPCYSAPNTTSRFAKPNGFPEITLRKILTSSTMERNLSDFAEVGTTTIDVKHLVGGSADSRLAVFTLDQPTLYSWINLTGNTTCSSGTVRPLLDAVGNYVFVDSAYDYVAIGLIQYNGQFITNMYGFLNYSVMGALDDSHPERLCWSQTYGQATLSCIWYYKKPKS
jgi:hypothetical protein